MLDFVYVDYCSIGKQMFIKPRFKLGTDVRDIMTRGNSFYAVWDFVNECWTENQTRAYELIDETINEFIKEQKKTRGEDAFNGVTVLYAKYYDTGTAEAFIKYIKAQINYSMTHSLNTKVVFKSDPSSRELYSSKRLPYDPLDVPTPNYDELMSVIYSDEERQKIEWLVGAALCGDNDKIQKFGVFYGDPGTGKGTVLDIISWLFGKTDGDRGYTTYFEASALGKSADQFALEPFKNNPVVAIQADGNLSRIEDNSRLNTLIAHEPMVMNEKNKGRYITKFDTVLFMASNEPVKITNAKSGLLRRLIDIRPTGKMMNGVKFKELKSKIKFELSGIAYQCMELYSNNKSLYDSYRPMDMMAKTNDFYDFILEYYDKFLMEDYVTLATTWEWYKKYAEDSSLTFKLQRRQFALELSSYFESGPLDEWRVDENGARRHVSSVYRGFKKEKFKNIKSGVAEVAKVKKKEDKTAEETIDIPDWLKLCEVISMEDVEQNPFNLYFSDGVAQYAVLDESGKNSRPKRKWDDVRVKLRSINTTKEHYILTQTVCPNLIVVDFDLKGDDGEKSLKKNLEAASKFPKTYAETSKSGKGLHLHYIYDGDVNELSMLYDTDVEIKVFKGNSALRRRLSLCNNVDIQHLSSGLPLKEVKKKVIDLNQIENEKHLRACIMKALQRKVHANTRPNVDYIKHVVEEAYEGGVSYDISDLMSKIFNFASMSTNQSEYCMNVAISLPVRSPDKEDTGKVSDSSEYKKYISKPIAFYDIEIFPNLFILCYKIEGGVVGDDGKKEVIKLINPSPNEVSNFVNSYRIIGFNNIAYDNIIVYARILGYSIFELYKLSHDLINDKERNNKLPFNHFEATKLSYTDIYDFSTKKQGLKKWEIELGIHHQELHFDWDTEIEEKNWPEVSDYCANDVVATEALFYHLKTDWKARQILADIAGMTVNDSTNKLTLRIVFGKEKNPRLLYTDLSTGMQKETIGGLPLNRSKLRSDEENSAEGFYKPDSNIINVFPGYIFEDALEVKKRRNIYRGVDVSLGGYVYANPGMYRNVALIDAASMHPTSIIMLNKLGAYTKRYTDLRNARVYIKHKDYEAASKLFEGKLQKYLTSDEEADELSKALKLPLNAFFGQSFAGFPNPARDVYDRNNIIALRGALFMKTLQDEVTDRGFKVVHIKTDSIKIADATPEIISFVQEFGEKYGYEMEHEATYDRMCLVNDAVYIAKYDEYGIRNKGGKHANEWTATGAEFQHPYIFKTMFTKEPVTFSDMCETKSVTGNDVIYLDMNKDRVRDLEDNLYKIKEEIINFPKGQKGVMDLKKQAKQLDEEINSIHNYIYVGKCGSFVPVDESVDGGLLVRSLTVKTTGEKKMSSVVGAKGYRWLEAENVKNKGLEEHIDKLYFKKLVEDVYKDLEKYGDAEEFIHG